MTASSTTFAQEMTSIANIKVASAYKRLAEAGIGAALGGGGTYLATGSGEGAAGGAGLGAAAGLLAGRLGAHRQFAKRLKEFMSSKKVTDSAQQLAEGSPLLSRPGVIRQQIDMLDTHDVYPHYFDRATKEMGLSPQAFDGISAMRARERDVLDRLKDISKTQSQLERQMRKYKPGSLSSVPQPLLHRHAHAERHEKNLMNRLQAIRSVLRESESLQQEAQRRARSYQKAARTRMRQSLQAAEDDITKQREAHAKMLEDSESQIRKDVNNKLFGLL